MTTIISIHAPLAGSDRVARNARADGRISIHAPLAGSDQNLKLEADKVHRFQSTPPSRGATAAIADRDRYSRISIHAPLAGSDVGQ